MGSKKNSKNSRKCCLAIFHVWNGLNLPSPIGSAENKVSLCLCLFCDLFFFMTNLIQFQPRLFGRFVRTIPSVHLFHVSFNPNIQPNDRPIHLYLLLWLQREFMTHCKAKRAHLNLFYTHINVYRLCCISHPGHNSLRQ